MEQSHYINEGLSTAAGAGICMSFSLLCRFKSIRQISPAEGPTDGDTWGGGMIACRRRSPAGPKECFYGFRYFHNISSTVSRYSELWQGDKSVCTFLKIFIKPFVLLWANVYIFNCPLSTSSNSILSHPSSYVHCRKLKLNRLQS